MKMATDAKCYSVILGTTPDVGGVDQMSAIICLLK